APAAASSSTSQRSRRNSPPPRVPSPPAPGSGPCSPGSEDSTRGFNPFTRKGFKTSAGAEVVPRIKAPGGGFGTRGAGARRRSGVSAPSAREAVRTDAPVFAPVRWRIDERATAIARRRTGDRQPAAVPWPWAGGGFGGSQTIPLLGCIGCQKVEAGG